MGVHTHHTVPCSVEWFIQRAGLHYYNEGVSGCGELHEFSSVPGGVEELLPAGQVCTTIRYGHHLVHLHPSDSGTSLAPHRLWQPLPPLTPHCIGARQVTQEKLLAEQDRVLVPEHLSLTLDSMHFGGHDRRRLSEVPIYVHAKVSLSASAPVLENIQTCFLHCSWRHGIRCIGPTTALPPAWFPVGAGPSAWPA